MNFGTKGCMYNCGDECTGECIGVETKTKMSKRENQIKKELSILKIELNSNYGVGRRNKEKRCRKIFDRILKLKEELKQLNQNKGERNC